MKRKLTDDEQRALHNMTTKQDLKRRGYVKGRTEYKPLPRTEPRIEFSDKLPSASSGCWLCHQEADVLMSIGAWLDKKTGWATGGGSQLCRECMLKLALALLNELGIEVET